MLRLVDIIANIGESIELRHLSTHQNRKYRFGGAYHIPTIPARTMQASCGLASISPTE